MDSYHIVHLCSLNSTIVVVKDIYLFQVFTTCHVCPDIIVCKTIIEPLFLFLSESLYLIYSEIVILPWKISYRRNHFCNAKSVYVDIITLPMSINSLCWEAWVAQEQNKCPPCRDLVFSSQHLCLQLWLCVPTNKSWQCSRVGKPVRVQRQGQGTSLLLNCRLLCSCGAPVHTGDVRGEDSMTLSMQLKFPFFSESFKWQVKRRGQWLHTDQSVKVDDHTVGNCLTSSLFITLFSFTVP